MMLRFLVIYLANLKSSYSFCFVVYRVEAFDCSNVVAMVLRAILTFETWSGWSTAQYMFVGDATIEMASGNELALELVMLRHLGIEVRSALGCLDLSKSGPTSHSSRSTHFGLRRCCLTDSLYMHATKTIDHAGGMNGPLQS